MIEWNNMKGIKIGSVVSIASSWETEPLTGKKVWDLKELGDIILDE